MTEQEVFDVLIVGAGPVGLSASALLSKLGYRTVVIESRAAATATAPRGHVISPRTMEIFELIGASEDVHAMNGKLHMPDAGFLWAQSLAGQQYCRLRLIDSPAALASITIAGRWSPLSLEQGFVEEALAKAAERQGAQVRYGHSCRRVDNVNDGVEAEVCGPDGGIYHIRARYCIACDGAASPVRKQHGVAMIGPTSMMNMANICFKADLAPLDVHNNILISVCNNPAVGGSRPDEFPPLVINYGTRKFCIHIPFKPDDGESFLMTSLPTGAIPSFGGCWAPMRYLSRFLVCHLGTCLLRLPMRGVLGVPYSWRATRPTGSFPLVDSG